jgi:hypothetical protein
MLKGMLDAREGILVDLHHDHEEASSLLGRILDTSDSHKRGELFREMMSKLLAHAKAEQKILYRKLENPEIPTLANSPLRARSSTRSSRASCSNWRGRAIRIAELSAAEKAIYEEVIVDNAMRLHLESQLRSPRRYGSASAPNTSSIAESGGGDLHRSAAPLVNQSPIGFDEAVFGTFERVDCFTIRR